mmetsp:Transcript_108925/g.339460  ORF Transcript_108925/g.339460 Transcript_108925/m.339460 type:complete len:217 (+) Transcript_108925:88-738(+)
MCIWHSGCNRRARRLCRLAVVTVFGSAVQCVVPSTWHYHIAAVQPSPTTPATSGGLDVGRRLAVAGMGTASWTILGHGAHAVDMVDPFADRAQGMVNLAVSQNPLKAFKEKQVIATGIWAKFSDEVEAALVREKPDFQRVKSLMDLKLAPVKQAMNRANSIAPEARAYQAAFGPSVNEMSTAVKAGDAKAARQALVAARAGFETWLAAKISMADKA